MLARSTLLALVMGLVGTLASGADASDPIAHVKERDAALSAAHGRGDMSTYLAGLSARYVYIDVGGRRVTARTLASRRANDQLRLVETESSEEEAIQVGDSAVLLRGLERSKFTYFGGLPRHGASRWTALWVREEDGQWRLLAETATPVVDDGGLPFTHVPQPASVLAAHEGRWTLALPVPLQLTLKAEEGRLVGTLAEQSVRFVFSPASATHFYALDRPFELKFSTDGSTLTFISWGLATVANRTKGP